MKHVIRLGVILGVSLAGEALNALIPLPIPASIYGLVLMLLCLCTGLIKLEQVESAGRFLIEIMPVMFIPAAVGIIESWPALRPMLLPVATIMVVSTLVVMGVSGAVTQALMRRGKKPGKGDVQ